MGTDIHPHVETREPDGTWRYRGVLPETLAGRDYAWFGIIAGVRERWNLKPIAMGRGIPADASAFLLKARSELDEADVPLAEYCEVTGLSEESVKEAHPYYCYTKEGEGEYFATPWLGEHDFTWITLRELLEYDWDQPIPEDGHGYYTENGPNLRDWLGRTLDEWIGYLMRFGAAPDDVRVVMGFDS